MKKQVCRRCRNAFRARKIPATKWKLFECRVCQTQCCEHVCIFKVGNTATCGTCNFNARHNKT